MRIALAVTMAAAVSLAACSAPSRPMPSSDQDSVRLISSFAAPSTDASIAQDEFEPGPNGAIPMGVGFTADPGTFLLGAAVDIPADENLYWGPALHVGFDSAKTLIAPFMQVKYLFANSTESRFTPFVQCGAGVVFFDPYDAGSELRIMANVGGGVRYDLNEKMQLSSTMLFNWVPRGIGSDHAYLSWEVIQLVVPF